MTLTIWEIAQLFARWLQYFGISSVVGGLFAFYLLCHQPSLFRLIKRYVLLGAILGGMATIAYFFILVGAVMEEGIGSMFDSVMVSVFWHSPAGSTLIANLIGYSLVVVGILTLQKNPLSNILSFSPVSLPLMLIGIMCLVYSFSLSGHSTNQAWYYQALFFTHIVIAAWWLGLLYPLWLVTRKATPEEANAILEEFGNIAMITVLILIVCGTWMSYELTGWAGFFTSNYGFWLFVKLALVVAILVIAAWHKLHVVPLILKKDDTRLIQKSILTEKIVASSILAVTAMFTTFLSPPMH